ncbi:helix-turn-helix domain-containing protein [Rhizobium sp. Root1220]|uniref:helix-turn-helix domain-containing protein n=1 Tax=Rhizobium sp. Root1220 TaxID=1736432 RepID=UPI0006FDB63D|nr:helix-turn-helix domain-containing protein [Rhizobium sp. Root1220]KQV66335.1 AraC family transcriptional regulator [Rhizobium sp. Root1220]
MKKSVPTYELYGESAGRERDFWLHCETIPSRSRLHHWEIQQHRHDGFFQILYISAGSGDAIFGSERREITRHMVITVPSGLGHGFRFSRDIDGFVITVLTSQLKTLPGGRSPLGAWLAHPHLTKLDMDDPEAAYVAQTLSRLGSEFASHASGRADLLEAYVTVALQLTMRLSGSGVELLDETGRRMELLESLIHRHLRSHKTAAFYARELGISPTHLSRVVRAVTGHGTHELIAGRLTEEAKRELVFSFGSVQEIGYRLGFVDPAYFSRFFLKQTGETPRAWRTAERAKLRM